MDWLTPQKCYPCPFLAGVVYLHFFAGYIASYSFWTDQFRQMEIVVFIFEPSMKPKWFLEVVDKTVKDPINVIILYLPPY